MPSFAEIPVEVFIDNFLPNLPVASVLRLTCTNKYFAAVCSDDTFWKRKLENDFNFSGAETARVSGWKFIYRGLFNPRVYVWGEKSNGRLGLQRFPKTVLHDVPFPARLHIPSARIVSLAAGGMSFYALDSEGNIYVWGAMDGSLYALNSDGFSEAGKCANTPLRLQMPYPTRSISCGRLHASSLDSQNRVWTFLNWGRPFWLSSPLLTDPSSKPIQVECGWGFSCILTQQGDVLVWWPFSGNMKNRIQSANEEMDAQGDKKANPEPGNVIPCAIWALDVDPVQLPSIPSLPVINNKNIDEDDATRLVKLAGLDGHVIGLTNKGHVLKFGSLDDETSAAQGSWEYLPEYSEVDKVCRHPTFSQSGIEPPKALHITHISANFSNFTAYSAGNNNSVVLMGNIDTDARSQPKIIPEVQNKGVISVNIGDYHNVALTSQGKVLTWGAYSAGALGLGDPTTLPPGTPGAFRTEEHRLLAVGRGRGEPPAVEVPTEVRFDYGRDQTKERFCFAIAAAGWHTGALVIDLEPDTINEIDEVELEGQETPGPSRGLRLPAIVPGEAFPTVPFPGIFRVGYAGRGRGGGFGGFNDPSE